MKSKTPWLYRPQVKGRLPKPFAPWLSKRKISPAETLRQQKQISKVLMQDPLYRVAYKHYKRFHDALDRNITQREISKLQRDKNIRLAEYVVPLMQQGELRNYVALELARGLMTKEAFQEFSKKPEFKKELARWNSWNR